MNLQSKLASEKPVFTIMVLVVVVIVVVAGAVVTIVQPSSLSFHQYVSDIAFMAGALGLGAGIGRGVETYGNATAAAEKTDPTFLGGNVVPDIPIDEVPSENVE
jgi:hypothetical protein